MTGSVALDVVIGLVFIYLLYSLLATVVCEIIAHHWGLRARNLLYSIERMLEDSPVQSENRIKALLRQMKDSIIRLYDTPEGPASCVFYRLPVIKYLAKNTFHSKPSYITRQTFSKALFEIFRNYGGSDAATDLEKIHNVLDGKLEHKGVLKSIRDEIAKGVEINEVKEGPKPDYDEIYDEIVKIAKSQRGLVLRDATQAKLYKKVQKLLKLKKADKVTKVRKKEVVFEIDEMLNLFGHETRGHMRSLLKDSNDDLLKFKLHLEQWFDDTQDRAAGWYKQKIQVLLLFIGLVFAAFFNANTIDIVHKLAIDKDARDKMVQLASDYINDTNRIEPNKGNKNLSDSLQKDHVIDSLRKVQAKLQKQINDANTLVGAGWPDLPDSLSLYPWTQQLEDCLSNLAKRDELNYSIIELDTVIRDSKFTKRVIVSKKDVPRETTCETLTSKIYPDSLVGKTINETVTVSSRDNKRILVYPTTMTGAVLGCIDEAWVWGAERYKGFNKEMTKIKVETGLYGTILYLVTTLFSKAFWGFFLTAIAISLGAPFWFDLLNKLMQIRGSVREPTHAHSGGTATTTSGGISDPAHPINRKG